MRSPAPSLSRSNSQRLDVPSRPSTPSRPGITRRDSSPMRNMATLGLLAANAALVSALPHGNAAGLDIVRTNSPQPRAPTRLEEDLSQVAGILRRDAQGVDWSAIDYSGVDYSGVDWSTINYGDAAATQTSQDVPSRTASPSFYLDQALTTLTQSVVAKATPVTQDASGNVQVPVAAQQPAAQTSAAATTTAAASAPAATDAAVYNTGTISGQVPMSANIDYFPGIDAGTNAIAIVWRGAAEQVFNFYADAAAFQPQFGDAFKSVTLQPNSFQTVQLPPGFSGRVQKMTGKVDEPATWPEVTFNGWKDLTFFDVSYIRGNNGAVVMKMADNSAIAGTAEDLISEAPDDDKGTSSTGQPYLKATEGFDGSLTSDLISFYRSKLPTTLGYVRNFDDSATKGSPCKHLIVTAW